LLKSLVICSSAAANIIHSEVTLGVACINLIIPDRFIVLPKLRTVSDRPKVLGPPLPQTHLIHLERIFFTLFASSSFSLKVLSFKVGRLFGK
jgi:hypothetical protein